jgi:hypothetical protein
MGLAQFFKFFNYLEKQMPCVKRDGKWTMGGNTYKSKAA